MWGCEIVQWTSVVASQARRDSYLAKLHSLINVTGRAGIHIWATVSLCPANISFTGQPQAVLSMALFVDSNTRIKGFLGPSQQFCTRSGLVSYLIQTLEAFVGLELPTGCQPGALMSDLSVTCYSEIQPLPGYRVFCLPWLLKLELSIHFCRPRPEWKSVQFFS